MHKHNKKILVSGGLGFLGSQIVRTLALAGYAITVVDGLFKDTGGSIKNRLDHKQVNYILEPVEKLKNLQSLVESHHLIIDCMGWTSHLEAFKSPLYDLELNVASHWQIIRHLNKNHTIILLGSRGQYGLSSEDLIVEDSPLKPIDVQGIHKVAAESYYRVYSSRIGYTCFSLRLPNCFGPFQKFEGNDIGLIGSIIKDLISDKTVTIFGYKRQRSVLFSVDLANIIHQLLLIERTGSFIPLNINGLTIPIIELAESILSICGKGNLVVKEVPGEIKLLDSGNESLSEATIKALIGELNYTPINESLSLTINYIKHNYDLQM